MPQQPTSGSSAVADDGTQSSEQSTGVGRGDRKRSLRRLLYENQLSLVLLGLFFVFAIGQTFAGWMVVIKDQESHGRTKVSLTQYVFSAHYWEALSENWESEFLQMGAFIWLTAWLVQRGSPESNAPEGPPREQPLTHDSPWPARQGGWIAAVYGHSLSLAFLALFAGSWAIHAVSGAGELNRERAAHGEAPVPVAEFIRTSEFWFQSLQNWQSEFLAIGAMVVLSIWLRERHSPESKDPNTSHSANR